MHRPSAFSSLRWRLPILISALMVALVATFLAIAYREVKTNLLLTAGTRAHAIADQVSALFTQSTQQRLTEVRRAASQPPMQELLEKPDDDAVREAARSSLARIAGNVASVIDIWDSRGQLVTSFAFPPSGANTLPPPSAPSAAGIGSLQRHGDVIFGETAVEIGSEGGTDGTPSRDRLGFLVVRRPITTAAAGGLLSRLAGDGAIIELGNKTGGVWTDLSKPTDPPPVNLTTGGVSSYQGADGQQRIGALADIKNTPWAVWVEFPHAAALGPARAFWQRMIVIALGLVAISGVAIGITAARITTPLHALTQATEAIAAGQYDRRVAIDRRDEIGRLSVAFNAMIEQVRTAHHGLEERVRERTAGLEEAGELLAARIGELKEAREELDRFFSLSLDLLCIADHEGRFVRVNPAWEEVLGWSRDELTAVPYLDFVHPDDRTSTSVESTRLADGSATFNFENRYRHKNGSYRWLSWQAVSDVERGVVYAAARDVTAQKDADRELQRHADELAAVNRELEAFSYSVSHDLRAPLRHITGFAMMLQQSAASSLDGEGRRYLKTITDAATRMGRLIDDLLSFSRVGRMQLARSAVDLNQLTRDAQQEVAADVNGRAVTWQIDRLPVVEGDPSLLRLVMVNLLSNALKYSAPRPHATIEVGAETHGGSEAVIFVRDNGVGFDMLYADKLFGVFQRLHSSDEFEGTGIGLANVRRIVQRHGGRTWASGRVDAGATFYFSLPAERRAS